MHERYYPGGEDFEKERLIEDYERTMAKGRAIDMNSEKSSLQHVELFDQLESLITTPNTERVDDAFISTSRLSSILDHIGLPSAEIIEAWSKAFSYVDMTDAEEVELRSDRIISNYKTMMHLELNEPHGAKVLHDEFGIKAFGRYSSEFLCNQLRNRNNRDVPYGIALFPRDDHNGAFYASKPILDGLSDELADSHAIRVYEVEGKLGVAKCLLGAERRYGPSEVDGHRIAFGILGGHGSDTAIHFDVESHLSALDTYFMSTRWDERLRTIFDDDATLLLLSCSTGKGGGIAQQLSDILRITVIAPEDDSYMEKCDVKISETLTFDVQYAKNRREAVETKIYHPEDEREALTHLDLSLEEESCNFDPVAFGTVAITGYSQLHQ